MQIFFKGKPTTLKGVAKKSDPEIWKKYLETRRVSKREIDDYLRSKLGDYISASEVKKLANIHPSKLYQFRNSVSSEKFKGRWYYSVVDLLRNIKAGNL